MFDTLAAFVVYRLLGLHPETHLGSVLHFFVMDVTKIFTLLVVIVYAMGLFRTLLEPERVRTFLAGRSRGLARLLAILLGAITPFCSCSSVPLFIGFVEAGIPLGVTFSFLIASPMINEVATVVLLSVLGLRMTLVYVASGLVVAFLGGAFLERVGLERFVEGYVWKVQVGQAPLEARPVTLGDRHRYGLEQVREIVGRIWAWVLAGVGAGALFHGLVPEAWVAAHLGASSGALAVPGAVLLGVPLYSNATGVIPVAEALLGKGVATGTVLAFMMSVSALSLPEMLILRKVIRWPALGLFAAVLAVAFTLVGWGINLLSTLP